MNISDIKNKLRDYLSKFSKNHAISDDDNIFESGIMHSLIFIQLLVFIEKNFAVELDESEFDISTYKSIQGIANLIMEKM